MSQHGGRRVTLEVSRTQFLGVFDIMVRVTFLHPDLGIGGAERLVVDAALALKHHGNDVHIVTTHHDKNHAFEETTNGELNVTVVGDWIPRSIFNRFYALMAYIRMVYAAFYVIFCKDLQPDVVFCDLVSVAVPILKIKFDNVIFYCHYPDQLLSKPEGFLKACYRAPLDWLEEVSLGKASHVFVNSKFTAKVFKDTFKRLSFVNVDILYPSLNMSLFDSFDGFSLPSDLNKLIDGGTVCFLSINRYERKKNLNLALEAFNELRHLISDDAWVKSHLVLAGGYDLRVNENVEYLEELTQLRSNLNLNDKVTFLKSISDVQKLSLLKTCICLLYTPSNEHFGIVPIEAMYLGKPVIAVNSGGPTETIINGETGFLCDPSPKNFAKAMRKFVVDESLSQKLGEAGRKRVTAIFSFKEFASKLNSTINDMINKKKE